MLVRHVAQSAASPFTLDFLAPSLLFKRHAATHSSPRRNPVKHSRLQSREQRLVPPVPSSSSTYNAAALLNKLDQQLQIFHQQLVGNPTDSQAAAINKAIPELRSASQNADIDRAWELWEKLKEKKLIGVFGPPQFTLFSGFVVTVCRDKAQREPWSRSEAEALGEIAVVTAAGGATEGLLAYMLSHLHKNNPQVVLHLYYRYIALIKDQEAGAFDPGQAEEEPGVDDSEASPTSSVRAEVTLVAVAAHAMQDTFADALRDVLQTYARFTPNITATFLARLQDETLRHRVAEYIHRLETARLVARHGAFSRQLANLTRDHADRSLRRLYSSIVEGLSGPNPWLAVDASAVGPTRPVLVPEFAWASFITGFMRCRKMDLAESLWDDMIRLGVRPTLDMWIALLEGYGDLKKVDEALRTWSVMQSQGYRPNIWTHRALIWGLFHAGETEEAFRRFRAFEKDLPTMSPHPEESAVLVVYNTVLHGLLFHFKTDEAHSLLRLMQQRGPTPDIVTFNNFLRYYGRKGDLKMLGDVTDMIETAGLVGDVFTFSILLSALLKIRSDATQIVLNLMKKQGVKPNTATLSSIIDHQMRAQTEVSFRSALELLARMEQLEQDDDEEDTRPNEVTYTSILTGIHRGDWLEPQVVEEYKQLIWEKMRERNINPTRTTYNILLKACFDSPRPDGVQHALRYFREMQKQRIFIANDTWFIMLRGLVDKHEWALANELVDDLLRSMFVPAAALSNLISLVRRRMQRKARGGPANYF